MKQENNVRIVTVLLVVVSLLFSLVGCEIDTPTDTTESITSTTQDLDGFETQHSTVGITDGIDVNMIALPMSNWECEEHYYAGIVEHFTNAGFTNVIVVGYEVEDYGQTTEGSVIIVSVDDNPIFEKNQLFADDVPIIIYYRTLVEPAPTTQAPTENITIMVWIPTNGGTKYHSRSSCSNMKNPQQVTKKEAEQMGYEPCKRCH